MSREIVDEVRIEGAIEVVQRLSRSMQLIRNRLLQLGEHELAMKITDAMNWRDLGGGEK